MITFPIEEPFHRVVPDVLAGGLQVFVITNNMVIIAALPEGFPQFPCSQHLNCMDNPRNGCGACTPVQAISLRKLPALQRAILDPKQKMHMIRHNHIAVHLNIIIHSSGSLYQSLQHLTSPGELTADLLMKILCRLGDWPAQGCRPHKGTLCFSFGFYHFAKDILPSDFCIEGYKVAARPGIIMAFQSLRSVHPLVFIQHNS